MPLFTTLLLELLDDGVDGDAFGRDADNDRDADDDNGAFDNDENLSCHFCFMLSSLRAANATSSLTSVVLLELLALLSPEASPPEASLNCCITRSCTLKLAACSGESMDLSTPPRYKDSKSL